MFAGEDLPGDGLQLMESAPQQSGKTLISGYVSDIAKEKLQKLNATFFEKPVPLRALESIILEQRGKILEMEMLTA